MDKTEEARRASVIYYACINYYEERLDKDGLGKEHLQDLYLAAEVALKEVLREER